MSIVADVTVERTTIHVLSIPLKGAFYNAQGGIAARDFVLVQMQNGSVSGWGEAAPYPGQDETIEEVVAAVAGGPIPATLESAVEFATADLAARVAGVSMASELGVEREDVPASIAVPIGGDLAAVVDHAVSLGVDRFKLKIAPGHVRHVAAIIERHPGIIVGVDANGSFESDTADELQQLEGLPIAYFEQPCGPDNTAVLERIRVVMDIPIFMDESVRTVADARTMLGSPLVDGVVVKPGRLGLSGSLETISEAQRVGKRWRASGLLESGVGRSYTDLISGLPSAFVSDVAPAAWFFETDVAPSRFEAGAVSMPSGPGIGFDPDPDVLDRYRVGTFDGADLFRRLAIPDRG